MSTTLHQKQRNTQIQKYALFYGGKITKKVHRSGGRTRQIAASKSSENQIKNK
ncbi:hypothetical protein [Dickeya dadantii]|uniref:hypothetical protein n=1 Tax=Dickeya dadantii TaxID=204038 RepID=UPI001C0DEDE8|nr:hypothetical protein [Dickeya dadantii]QWT40448.1 hypothetical protein KNV89_19330 [Dickeya dadantii]